VKNKGIQFELGKENCVEKIVWGEEVGQTYAGIGVFSERVFSLLPQERVFSIADIFQNILSNEEEIMGLPTLMQWHNINSPYSYWKIHHELLSRNLALAGLKYDSPIYFAPGSTVETKDLKGFVSIGEGCFIGRDVYLENTIVLPGSRVASGNYRNCVLSNKVRMIVA
jgi:NDP-sugar pyrophosphorylase family protein